jgi:hypothetical protein
MATYYDASTFDTWTDDGVPYQGVLTPEGEYHYWVVHGVEAEDYVSRSPTEDDEQACKACRYQTDDGHTEEEGCMFSED